jgi:hypothetical protein
MRVTAPVTPKSGVVYFCDDPTEHSFIASRCGPNDRRSPDDQLRIGARNQNIGAQSQDRFLIFFYASVANLGGVRSGPMAEGSSAAPVLTSRGRPLLGAATSV